MTIFYVLLTISTVAIAVFLFAGTYFRGQKIAKDNKQEGHTKAFGATAVVALAFAIATTIYGYLEVK